MVDSLPPQNLTLNPSETAYSFPLHRRRPLRSRTYGALVQFFSHYGTICPQIRLREPASGKDGSIIHKEVNPADVLVPLSIGEGFNNTIIQEDSNDDNKENTGFQDGGFDGKQARIPNFHHAKLVTDGEPDVAPSNRISVEDFLVVENQMVDCAIQNANEQENMNSVLDIQMDDFELVKEFCIDHFKEVLESCFDMDVESSKERQEGRDKGVDVEIMPKDAEHELQLKEMELQKLIHNSGGVESSFRPNADEEIEEGEISGEAGIVGESFDVLSDDAALLEKRTMEMMHASVDHFDNEKLFYKDEDKGRPRNETFDRSVVNSGDNSMKMERTRPAGQMQYCLSQNVIHDNHKETQKSGAMTSFLQNSTPPSRIHQENAAENQIPSTTEKDTSARKKKRKRGPLTKEKRDKRKKIERLKRAEKDRKLGVKRLKLQPVLKAKKIVYCRHYLQGKCHEGDKCNFSHDTIPLTKSKPCIHFARHSCMKGDECPFDHQLSNYPCTNYTSNGFCNRGSGCLFSHETKICSITPNVTKPDLMSAQLTVPDKGGSNPISKVTKPELNFLSPLNSSNKHMDNHRVLHQKVGDNFCSASNSPGKGVELPLAKPVPRTGVQPPRGVSFLSNRVKSVGDNNKEKIDGSSTKSPDGVGISTKAIFKEQSGISELNKVSEGAAPKKPRGVNFLSFGQPSTDDSRRKIFSNLLSNCDNETGKMVIDDIGEGNRTCLLPQGGGILKVNRQMNESATNLALGLNEKANLTQQTVPQNVNVLSFNRSHLDDSISKETANLQFNKSDASSSFVKEIESTSKLLDTIKTPSLSFGRLCDQSTGGQNASSSNSFKKSLFSNTPSLVQKAVQSTLSFAAKLESNIKVGSSHYHWGS